VVVLALVTTRRRNLREEYVTKRRDRLRAIQLPSLPTLSDATARLALQTIHLQWTGVLEAQQFMQLLRLLDDLGSQEDDIDKA
jgi:hypothetical protein